MLRRLARITSEVEGINRVLFDLTPKPIPYDNAMDIILLHAEILALPFPS